MIELTYLPSSAPLLRQFTFTGMRVGGWVNEWVSWRWAWASKCESFSAKRSSLASSSWLSAAQNQYCYFSPQKIFSNSYLYNHELTSSSSTGFFSNQPKSCSVLPRLKNQLTGFILSSSLLIPLKLRFSSSTIICEAQKSYCSST